MKATLTFASALALLSTGLATGLHAEEITLLTWGGTYAKSQAEAYVKPFTEKTGIIVKAVDSDNPAIPIKAQVEAKNVTTDVVDIEYPDAIRMCDEGLLEPIDPASLPPAPDGTPATEDFLPQGLSECAVGSIVFSTIYAYDKTKFPDAKPTTTAKFPGKRGLKRAPKALLEMALMGDGVPAAEVYQVLGTPEGVDRAFAKLDSIKNDVVWWEAGAQPPQLLADGEVTMAYAFNGRIFNAAVGEGKPFKIIWDGQIYEMEGWVVPKGAPNKDNAMQYIAFTTESPQLAKAAEQISYGPPRKSAAGLVGNIAGKDQPMGPHLPTDPANLGKGLSSNLDFWVDHDGELSERFNAWLAG